MNWLAIFNGIRRSWDLSLGYECNPVISTTTGANTPQAGCTFYCIKPLVGDATITTILDVDGNAITALAGAIIQQGDEFKIRFSSVTFSTTDPVVLYQKALSDKYQTGA
jgi:hypothetical protein